MVDQNLIPGKRIPLLGLENELVLLKLLRVVLWGRIGDPESGLDDWIIGLSRSEGSFAWLLGEMATGRGSATSMPTRESEPRGRGKRPRLLVNSNLAPCSPSP